VRHFLRDTLTKSQGHYVMPPKRPRDLNQWAKHMVDLATGAAQDPKILPASPAAELGRKGGRIGGKVRAQRMTAKQRSNAARKAAKARWGK
jgi:hypothetical protein